LYCIVLHCIALHCIALHCIALHCIALHCIALHCIVLYCIVLYCIVLYCIVLYCIVLYCIVLYCICICIVLYLIIFIHSNLSIDIDFHRAGRVIIEALSWNSDRVIEPALGAGRVILCPAVQVGSVARNFSFRWWGGICARSRIFHCLVSSLVERIRQDKGKILLRT
jgi:hypothetical protein